MAVQVPCRVGTAYDRRSLHEGHSPGVSGGVGPPVNANDKRMMISSSWP